MSSRCPSYGAIAAHRSDRHSYRRRAGEGEGRVFIMRHDD
jgi:hypothetical protein